MRSFLVLLLAFSAPQLLLSQSSPDGQLGQRLGFSSDLAIDGDHIIVSKTGHSSLESSPPVETGAIFVFEYAEGGWIEKQVLEPEDLSVKDGFGHAIAVTSSVLAISAPWAKDGCGTVYTYIRSDINEWIASDKINIPDCLKGAHMGMSLDAVDNAVVIGAPDYNDHGAAGLAVYRDSTWTYQPLEIEGLKEGDKFGSAVAIEKAGILVSSLADSSGAVHFFQQEGLNTVHAQRIDNPFGAESSHFGFDIDWVASRAIISAPGSQPGRRSRGKNFEGKVQIIDLDQTSQLWSLGKTIETDSLSVSGFGASVLLKGSHVWIGSPNGMEGRGVVHTFGLDQSSQEYELLQNLHIEDLRSRVGFAMKMAVGEDIAVISAINNDFGEGSAFVFMQDEHSANWRLRVKLEDLGRGLVTLNGDDIRCEDGMADEFSCSNVDILSFMPNHEVGASRGMIVNDVWGWTDPQTGAEIAIIGRADGTSFIDVSDANNPVYLGDLPATEGTRAHYWRDIKTYQNHAFIVADNVGNHGMQIFDLTRLRELTATPVVLEVDVLYDNIASSHNVIINEDSGFAYLVGNSDGGETCGGALHMVDIRDPKNPIFAGCYIDTSHPNAGRGGIHDAQCVNYTGPDEEHQGKELCFSANESIFLIVDVSDKKAPTTISSNTYPNVAYTHQGWLTEDQRYFYLNDEGDETSGKVDATRTMIYDVADLDDPVLVKEYFGPTNVSDHNLYVKDNFMYQSNYVGGLRIIDVADPVNPVEVGFFDTVPWSEDGPGFTGSWSNYPFFKSGTIVVSSQNEGVFFLKQRKTAL